MLKLTSVLWFLSILMLGISQLRGKKFKRALIVMVLTIAISLPGIIGSRYSIILENKILERNKTGIQQVQMYMNTTIASQGTLTDESINYINKILSNISEDHGVISAYSVKNHKLAKGESIKIILTFSDVWVKKDIILTTKVKIE